MRRIVNSIAYNTITSTKIARSKETWDDARGLEWQCISTLYQTQKGAFFVCHDSIRSDADPTGPEAHELKNEFQPMSRDEASKWLLKGQIEIIDESFAEGIPEAGDEPSSGSTIYVRVPPALKKRIDEAASANNLSAAAWALKCFERCVTEKAA